MANLKLYFQEIHYLKTKPSWFLDSALNIIEFFYGIVINFKNLLYDFKILTEKKINANVICVGNLTTGGVGKTPTVMMLAKNNPDCCIISRGYGAKISNKNPVVIKDKNKIYFKDGTLCGDEVFQLAKNTPSNCMVIICSDRYKAGQLAVQKYGIKTIILDDGFSNRKLKKDKTILLIDSKMRFGNGHLLPKGPLREPQSAIKRADEIVIVNKMDEDIKSAISWAKMFKKPLKLNNMTPLKIYNMQTRAQIVPQGGAVAFCAIGQPEQFYNYARKFYKIEETISFEDHYKYCQYDVNHLIEIAKKYKVRTLLTTQKDEAKLINLTKDVKDFNFNVLELKNEIIDI
ncbi:MAG: tetraacyldisaccharide 4'-kinase [Candidatus Gastranaerophilales bacterium]|nr:tetraacyldisaccharide 4'-kinase [Candidatus Gastranaerophilales bacterium]